MIHLKNFIKVLLEKTKVVGICIVVFLVVVGVLWGIPSFYQWTNAKCNATHGPGICLVRDLMDQFSKIDWSDD